MDLKPLFVFPRWSNTVTLSIILFLLVFPVYAGALVAYALDPVTLNAGYQPTQVVAYSHKLHAGELGIDCRYCHNTVEKADFAAIPPTETCMNCHKAIRPQSDLLKAVRDSYVSGDPIKWKKVNDVPDYVYFNHAAHVNAAISCVECHGNVNHMETVAQVMPMNMAWCLQCHRDPTSHIRPRDQVTKLDWEPSADDPSTVAAFASLPDGELQARAQKVIPDMGARHFEGKADLAKAYVRTLTETEAISAVKTELGAILKDQYHINPNTDCVTCHR